MQNILLLGGAGFMGTNISSTLLEAGYDVTILDRSYAHKEVFENFKNKPTHHKIDLLNFEAVAEIIRHGKFDLVIHLITNMVPGSSFNEFLQDSDLNIKIGFRLLDEIYKAGIKNYIYFSSGGTVYGNNGREVNSEDAPKLPISLYGWYKNAMEQYIQTYAHSNEINYAILRPSNPYGYYQNINGNQGFIAVAMGKILRNQKIEIWGDGNVIRDYIFINDLAYMVVLLIKKGFQKEVFNIGTGEGHSLNELLLLLKEITGKKVEVEYLENRTVDVQRNILDVSAIKAYLNSGTLNTPIEEGILKMWVWICKNNI